MKRAVDGVGKLMVGGDGKKYIGCLHRNLEFMEVIVLKYARVFERRFNKRLRTGFGVFLQKMFLLFLDLLRCKLQQPIFGGQSIPLALELLGILIL